MESERSSSHLTNCTEDPFPPWPWIHTWKHAACEAEDEKWRFFLQKEITQSFQKLENRLLLLSPSYVLTPNKQFTLYLLTQIHSSQSLAAMGPSWRLYEGSWSFPGLPLYYKIHTTMQEISAAPFWKPFAVYDLWLRWQLSFLPTK